MRIKLFAGLAMCLIWTLLAPGGRGAGTGAADAQRFEAWSPSGENRGHAYVVRGLRNESAGNFARALLDYAEAIRMEPKSRLAHYYRGCLHHELGNLRQAIADLDVFIRLENNYGAIEAHLVRGHVHAEMGQRSLALADYAEVIQRAYTNAEGRGMRADAYKAKGEYAAASADYAKARQMSPRDADALNALAWFRATCPDRSFRNGREAVQDATKACELTKWEDGHNIDTLAAAYAEVGDFGNAVKYQTQAMSKGPLSAGARKEMEQRLRLFKQHKPWREKSEL
jgi:tetratricopeptide (TPR) repeat protein